VSASFIEFFKSGPPAPRVVLLSDQRFFARAMPVVDANDAEQVASQLEIALEAISPFPPGQLYFGFHWVPGSAHALVFSSYRKRFPSDQVDEWGQAVLVMPTFAAFSALDPKPATTLVYPTADGLTAVHWDNGPVPSRVLTAHIPAETSPEEQQRIRDKLLRDAGETKELIELTSAPEVVNSSDDSAYLFRAGEFETRLPVESATNLDVRDPVELAAYRKGARRDVNLWRTTAASLAVLLVLGVLEITLAVGGGMRRQVQGITIEQQSPQVTEIQNKARLAADIERLASENLLPLEMMTIIGGDIPQRGQITWTSASATETNLDTLVVLCSSPNAGDAENYRLALSSLPQIESVEITSSRLANGVNTFTLNVTFAPGALEKASQVATSAQ